MLRRLFAPALRTRGDLGRFVLTLLVYAATVAVGLLAGTLLIGLGIAGTVAAAVLFLYGAYGLAGTLITAIAFLRTDNQS